MQVESIELMGGAEAVLPASFAQQRMWFLERFEGGAVYNVPAVNRLRGPLDVAALERALGLLIERHESLRTVFTLVDGVLHQVIRPAQPFSLDVVDVSRIGRRRGTGAADRFDSGSHCRSTSTRTSPSASSSSSSARTTTSSR